MTKVSFIKVESLGNDFVIVEAERSRSSWSASRAARVCDRRSGVGADGLIVLGPGGRNGIRFRLFNADGSGAEWSGNGVRGVGAYLAAMNPRQTEFHLDTLAGCIRIGTKRRKGGGVDAEFTRPMPSVTALTSRSASLLGGMLGRFLVAGPVYVDAGNPHCVFVVSGFDYDWEKVGADCQTPNRRTGGINVEFARAKSRRQIELLIYERGVGPTPSSGSGALAAIAACFAMDFIGTSVSVTSSGGTQSAVIGDAGESVTLKAPARIIMAGVWSDGDVTAKRDR